jgi:hypothetical protein
MQDFRSVTLELLRALCEKSGYADSGSRFDAHLSEDGWAHITPNGAVTAAELVKQLVSANVKHVGAKTASIMSWEHDGAPGIRWRSSDWENLLALAWAPMASKIQFRSLEDAQLFSKISTRYCWLPILWVDSNTAREDVAAYGPWMSGDILDLLVTARGLHHRRVEITTVGDDSYHIEPVDNGVPVLLALATQVRKAPFFTFGCSTSFTYSRVLLGLVTILNYLIMMVCACVGTLVASQALFRRPRKWRRAKGKAFIVGGRRIQRRTTQLGTWDPDSPGRCYLTLFNKRRWASVGRTLGRDPRIRHVLSARPDAGISTVSKSGQFAHLVSTCTRVTRFAELATSLRHARLGHEQTLCYGNVFGMESDAGVQQHTANADPFQTHISDDGFAKVNNDCMWRNSLTEGGLRNPANGTLHDLDPDIFASTREVRPACNARRARLWRLSCAFFRAAVTKMIAGRLVVVTSASTPPAFVTAHPEELVDGASHGVCFVQKANHVVAHPSWQVIVVPLREDEGRLLAGFRTIAAVEGRTDLNFAIVNGVNTRDHPVDQLRRLADAGLGYAAACRQYLPTNNGAMLVAGCIFRADRREFASSFEHYGHVYGWDEAVFATRNPAVLFSNLYDQPFAPLRSYTSFADVSILSEWTHKHGYTSRRVASFTREVALRLHQTGEIKAITPMPYPLVNNGWASLAWAERFIRTLCTREGIPLLAKGKAPRLVRAGGRFLNVDVEVPNQARGQNGHGAIWRRFEYAAGLRDRLNTSVTQSLNPDLWKEALHTTLTRPEHFELYDALVVAVEAISAWSQTRLPTEVVAVVSVASRAQALEFKAAHAKLFTSWLFLSENDGSADEHDEFWVVLPALYGSGNVFQLARLIPGIASHPSVRFSCVNDLETDMIPRAERLALGMKGLEYANCVFPGMELNAPNPFQDVCYTGDAFADKRESLLRCIARWGWVYGMDEVWAGAHEFPTLPTTKTPGGAATCHFANPKPANVWYEDAKGFFVQTKLPGGTMRAIGIAGDSLKSTPVQLSFKCRALRAFGLWAPKLRVYAELEPADWERYGATLWQKLSTTHAILFLTWGTQGDRTPVIAGAKALHRLTGVSVIVRHILTLDEGRAQLKLCEADKAIEFVTDLIAVSAAVDLLPGAVVMPDYLKWSSKGLAFSLRPGEADAASPGGGMPPWLDWFVQLIFWRDRAKIRVGLYKGTNWFPRSADGTTFLAMMPLRKPNTGLRGSCVGSSSIPIPESESDRAPVPSGDHYAHAQKFTDILCDGGAGKVQTFRAAGVPVVRTTNTKIDRKYRDINDCAKHCTGNEPAEKWALVAAWWWPRYAYAYCGLRPTRWLTYFWWRLDVILLARRMWTFFFFAWSMRYKGIFPTAEQTILVAVGAGKLPGLIRVPTFLVASKLMAWISETTNRSYLQLALSAARGTAIGMFSPVTSVLLGMGCPAFAAAAAAITLNLFSLGQLRKINFYPNLDESVTGIWLIMTPVYVKGIPIGMHASYYEPSSQTVWEGVGTNAHASLGTSFRLVERPLLRARPLIAVRSSLTRASLPSGRQAPAPYSAVWNCQTICLSLFLTKARTIWSIELVILMFFTSYATVAMTALAVAAIAAATMSITAMLVLTPLDTAFPAWGVRAKLQRARDAVNPAFTWFGAEDDETQDEDGEPDLSEPMIRDMAAIVAADAILQGFNEASVFETVADAVVAATYEADGDTQPSSIVCESLFHTKRGPSDLASTAWTAWINRITHEMRANAHISPRVLEGFAAFLGALLEWSEAVTIEIVAGLAAMLDWLEANGMNTHARLLADSLVERLGNFTDRSTRRKNVWAVLSKKRLETLRRADWFALSLKEMTAERSDNPAGWIANLVSRFHPDGEALSDNFEYKYPSWLPKRPRASAQEYEFTSLLQEADTQIDPELTARIDKYLTLGGKVGLDGMWVATDENREKVTSRYFSEPNPMTNRERAFAKTIADALFDAHPEAFNDPGVVRPETVAGRLNLKGRTGVPFMQKVKSRRALARTGWMDAIISATYECLDKGVYPPDAYSEFAKMMVLPAEDLVRKGPRTIMATSLLTNFVNGVFELERRTRKTWPSCSIGVGAPLTAAYMGKIFEDVSKREQLFTADATAFDANIPPILFEVLSLLGERGTKNFPIVGSALRTKYMQLQNAVIYDLPSGKCWPKRRGGATGQTATSWDNTWAMRALMIGAWSYATKSSPDDFYKHNTVHNTGDDNVWGTDSSVTPQQLADAAKELFGVEVRIEMTGEVTDLAYLAKRPVHGADHAKDILRVLDYVPKYTTVHDQARLLARRGAVISRFSGAGLRAYKGHCVDRTIGHLSLAVHNRPLFNLLAHEYMEDLRVYIGARPYAIIYDITYDDCGDIENVVPRFSAGYKPNTSSASRMKRARTSKRFPSYLSVLKTAYKEREAPPISKYAYARARPTLESVVREYVIQTRFAIHNILPDALIKLSPAPSAAPYSPIFFVWGFPTEKFVWRNGAVDSTLSEFAAELRQAPWSITTDPTGFWWFLDTLGGKESVLSEPMVIIRGRMVVATILYVLLTECMHILRASRLGLLFEAWQVYTQDAPRLFALLDSIHWLETSKSSPVISSLTPRDPYGTQKQIAMWAAAITPDVLCAFAGALHTNGAVAKIAELIAAVRIARVGANVDLALKTPHLNRWGPHVPDLKSKVDSNPAGVIVSAPTSTGKSTEFPAELLRISNTRVWVVCHTRYLRDTYTNPWVSHADTLKLSAGVVLLSQTLIVTTYGHLCARIAAGMGPAENDYVILDEFHERQPIQAIAAFTCRSRGLRVFYASATPDRLYVPAEAEYVHVPIEREWGEIVPTRLDLDPMALWAEAKRAGEDVSRCVFILHSIEAVEAVTLALLSAGEAATAVSARRRQMPRTGHIVGTSVVEAGVNIDPPATMLIDSGQMTASHKGRIIVTPTNPARAQQRLGRVGRRGNGAAYVHAASGTGDETLPYPTYLEILCGDRAREYMLSTLGIQDHVSHIVGATGVDLRMRISGSYSLDVRRALAAWWLMSMSLGSPTKANRAYDAVQLTGWPEELDAIASMLGQTTWLPPRSVIQEVIDSRPFEVLWDGQVIKPLTIILRDGDMHWS